MRRLLYLFALSAMLMLMLAPAAMAQNTACDQVRDRLNEGDGSLTSAELLSCGLSPEAINPCEGNPDPSCARSLPPGAFPSINGPNGIGRVNECSDLPQGSPEAVACFEELIASRGTATPPPPPEQPKAETKSETKAEAKAGGTEAKAEAPKAKAEQKKAEAKKKEEKKALPKTGGSGTASLLALGAGALLVGGGLLVRRLVR